MEEVWHHQDRVFPCTLRSSKMRIVLGDSLFSQLQALSGLVMKSGLFSQEIVVCAIFRPPTQAADEISSRFQLVY
jgi:hypothetical protein